MGIVNGHGCGVMFYEENSDEIDDISISLKYFTIMRSNNAQCAYLICLVFIWNLIRSAMRIKFEIFIQTNKIFCPII